MLFAGGGKLINLCQCRTFVSLVKRVKLSKAHPASYGKSGTDLTVLTGSISGGDLDKGAPFTTGGAVMGGGDSVRGMAIDP